MRSESSDIAVSVVLVTYNSASVVMGAVQSVDSGAEVIVVDNASADDTVERLSAAGVRTICNAHNVGFGAACNAGALAACREFVLFLNPDARLRPGALQRLLERARAVPQYGALNPRILGADGGQIQRQMSRLLTPELNATLKTPLAMDQDVEMITGAALLCRRDTFLAIGGFDEKIFLYCEDDDLAVRLRKAGLRLGYVQDAVVEHIGGRSSAPSESLEHFKSYHFMKATRYAMGKHGLTFRRKYQIVQCGLKVVLGVVTRNRRQQWKYRGYLKALLEPEA